MEVVHNFAKGRLLVPLTRIDTHTKNQKYKKAKRAHQKSTTIRSRRLIRPNTIGPDPYLDLVLILFGLDPHLDLFLTFFGPHSHPNPFLIFSYLSITTYVSYNPRPYCGTPLVKFHLLKHFIQVPRSFPLHRAWS